MSDQTPVTDDDRRNLREDAETVRNYPGSQRTAVRLAEYVLDTVPAPPATIADELRAWGVRPFDGLNWTRFHDLADRVEAVEKENRALHEDQRDLHDRWKAAMIERDEAMDHHADDRIALAEARAEVELLAAQIDRMVETYASEVERLTRERDEARDNRDAHRDLANRLSAEMERMKDSHRIAIQERDEWGEENGELRAEVERLSRQVADQMTVIHTANAEVERLTATFKEPLKEPGHLPDPADVPEGEAWLVQVGDEEPSAGIKVILNRWRVYHPIYGTRITGPHAVTLVARLVPDVRRVIDKVEGLDALPVGTVVLDKVSDPWQKQGDGRWEGRSIIARAVDLIRHLPVTVVHEPMIDSGDSDGGRTPGCPARG